MTEQSGLGPNPHIGPEQEPPLPAADTTATLPEVDPTLASTGEQETRTILGGVRRVLGREAPEPTADDLDDQAMALRHDLAVRTNSAQRMLIPGRPVAERGVDQDLEDHRTKYGYHVPTDMTEPDPHSPGEDIDRVIVPSLRPTTKAEQKAAAKADKLLRKNMSRAVSNSNAELVYHFTHNGEDVVIGTPEFDEYVETADLTPRERRDARKAAERFRLNRLAIEGNVGIVRHMAEGTDAEGRALQDEIDRLEAEAAAMRAAQGITPNTYPPTYNEAGELPALPDDFETISNPNRDPLNAQSRTEKALFASLDKMLEDRSTVMDEAKVTELLGSIDGATPALARFTLNKLRALRVIDNDGKVIVAPSALREQVDRLLDANQDRPRDLDEGAHIEVTGGLDLSNDRLDRIAAALSQATAVYDRNPPETVGEADRIGRRRAFEAQIIQGITGTITLAELKQVKRALEDLATRRASTRSSHRR